MYQRDALVAVSLFLRNGGIELDLGIHVEDARAPSLQGYLAHKKQPPPLGPPYDARYSPTVGSSRGCLL